MFLPAILAGCTGASGGGKHDAPDQTVAEDDWSLPAWAVASTNAGFFSEQADASHDIGLRVIDVSWRQLEPSPGVFLTDAALGSIPGYYDGLDFSALDDQLAAP